MLNRGLPSLALSTAMAAMGCEEAMLNFHESDLRDGGARICLRSSADVNALRSRAGVVAADKDRRSVIPFIVKEVRSDAGEICVDVVNLSVR